jgi:hypothetical protein
VDGGFLSSGLIGEIVPSSWTGGTGENRGLGTGIGAVVRITSARFIRYSPMPELILGFLCTTLFAILFSCEDLFLTANGRKWTRINLLISCPFASIRGFFVAFGCGYAALFASVKSRQLDTFPLARIVFQKMITHLPESKSLKLNQIEYRRLGKNWQNRI